MNPTERFMMRLVPQTSSRARCLALLAIGFGLSGCGGTELSDQGVVVITEPDKLSGNSPAPAPAGGSAPADAASSPSQPATATASTPAAATASGWGTLKGRVVFSGTVPPPEVLVAKGSNAKDAAVCATQDVLSEKLIVDPASNGVRNVLVYIPRPSAVNPEAESEALAQPLEFDQTKCVFVPHALAAMKGAKILVKSSDQAGHNVHSLLRGITFNQGIQPGSSVPVDVKTPDNRPGQVVCDIHPWMKAWWLTLGNPYFAVTNEKGEFEIKNVPAGDQKVVVWSEALHPAFITSSGSGDPVNIKPNKETSVDYTLDGSKIK
jgi:hypothetical protein